MALPPPSRSQMYIYWRDSIPAKAFPFRFVDKKEGVIQQTWSDVREKCNRDSASGAMPFCTGHYAPSALQNLMVGEMVKREHQNADKLQAMIAERQAAAAAELRRLQADGRPQRPHTAGPAGRSAAAAAATRLGAAAAAADGSATSTDAAAAAAASDAATSSTGRVTFSADTAGGAAAATATASGPAAPPPRPATAGSAASSSRAGQQPHVTVGMKKRALLLAAEEDALYNGEGGGRSRSAYLKLRRRLPLQQRFEIPKSTSQRYGWELLNRTADTLSQRAHANALSSRPSTPVAEFKIRALGAGEGASATAAVAGAEKPPPPRPGQPGVYWGRKAVMAQLNRKTGVF